MMATKTKAPFTPYAGNQLTARIYDMLKPDERMVWWDGRWVSDTYAAWLGAVNTVTPRLCDGDEVPAHLREPGHLVVNAKGVLGRCSCHSPGTVLDTMVSMVTNLEGHYAPSATRPLRWAGIGYQGPSVTWRSTQHSGDSVSEHAERICPAVERPGPDEVVDLWLARRRVGPGRPGSRQQPYTTPVRYRPLLFRASAFSSRTAWTDPDNLRAPITVRSQGRNGPQTVIAMVQQRYPVLPDPPLLMHWADEEETTDA